MKIFSIFRAQALDNNSTDHLKVDGCELTANDTIRQEQTSRLWSAMNNASYREEKGNVLVVCDTNTCVVQIPCQERDVAGRIAMITCLAPWEAFRDATFADIRAEIDDFARSINRNIKSEEYEITENAIQEIKKKVMKSQTNKTLKMAVGIAFGVIVLGGLVKIWVTNLQK